MRALDRTDRGHVAREVEHEPAPAGGLPGEARAAAARDDRHAQPRAHAHRRRDVVRVAREGDRERLQRVQAASAANRWRVYASSRISPASSRRSAAASSPILGVVPRNRQIYATYSVMVQASMRPMSAAAASWTRSFQVPLAGSEDRLVV